MILRAPRRLALIAITTLVSAASVASFAESYRGLYDWAREHGLSGLWAAAWPLQVDTFIAVGELALFVALADRWAARSRASAWAVTLAGLAVSVAGNVGHVARGGLAARVTAAVPPLAAAAALAVGLGVLKRVVEHHHQASPMQAEPEPPAGATPEPAPEGAPAPALAAALEGALAAAPEGAPAPAPGPVPDRALVPAPREAPEPTARRKPGPSLERRPVRVRRQILADLAAGRAYAELARQHGVSSSGMRAFARRHQDEVRELAAANGHAGQPG